MADDGYLLAATDEECERMGRQARLYGGVDPFRPFLAGCRKVLDAGCGSGHFAALLAAEAPAAEVTGLERDEGRVAYARARLWAPNLRFEAGDLHALPFAAESFDLCCTRFVLVHDADPADALRELARVTRPGGRIVAYDMVHDGIWFAPAKPAFTRLLAHALAFLREHGAEPNQGLHLGRGLLRAGLGEVEVRVIAHHAFGDEPLLEVYRANWLETIASLEAGIGVRFEPGLADAARAELEARTGDELLVETTVLAAGRKLTAP
jgi:SAM-dependent methyltransferase